MFNRIAALVVVLIAATPVLTNTASAQGQESTSGTQQGQTNAHPVPLLSEIDVTTVPDTPVLPGSPLPDNLRAPPRRGLDLPGPIALAAPARLACDAIQDEIGRAACQTRKAPAAPPR